MQTKLLLITPPFTQLNTAYPATSYLKGFLDEHEVSVSHCDLSIELFTSVFKSGFLVKIFKEANDIGSNFFPGVKKMKHLYIARVDLVIRFLQKHDLKLSKMFVNILSYYTPILRSNITIPVDMPTPLCQPNGWVAKGGHYPL